jgi:Starch-binding associating with outer membrane
MKYHKILGLSLAATLVIGGVGCSTKEFLDVNGNPNNPSEVPASVLLTSTVVSTAFSNGNEINRITSLLMQHMAGIGTQSDPQDKYNIRGGLDNQWQFEQYAGVLENTQDMIRVANNTNSPAYAGIAKILKAYNYAMVTDLWGDIPYSQALQGLDQLQPRFDKQEDIYKGNSSLQIQGLFDLVKEGLADLDKTSTLTPSAANDPVYAGDLTKWKKAGNTLLLKLANTISRRDPALATTIINQVLANPNSYITSNAEDFQVPFGGSVGNRNPIADFNGVPSNPNVTGQRPDDLLLSQRLLDSMRTKNDPRLPFYFTTTPTPVPATPTTPAVNITGTVTTLPGSTAGTFLTFTGYQNGAAGAVAIPARANRSRAGLYLTGGGGEAPIRLLTNFQALFIRAESALILGTAGDPQTLYQAAIRASMTKVGVTDAAVTAYFAANPSVANLTGTNQQKLNKIITQKWIAWVGNGYEAYNDYRRTGYPRLALSQNPQGDDPSMIPVRFVYPASESSGNAANAPNPLPGTNVRVWWDVD